MYNTRTGDKINVSDVVLTKAVQHRENVANGEFEKDKSGVEVNNCKPQVNQKACRSRFNTRTVLEILVGNRAAIPEDSDDDGIFEPADRETPSARKRKLVVVNMPSRNFNICESQTKHRRESPTSRIYDVSEYSPDCRDCL